MKVLVDPWNSLIRLSLIVSIILFIYIISFIHRLETIGCMCAEDWRKTFILFYSIYIITVYAIILFRNNTTIGIILSPLTFGLSIMFIIFTLQYIHRLKNEKCTCSNTLERAILYLVAAVDAVVFAVMGIQVLFMALIYMINYS